MEVEFGTRCQRRERRGGGKWWDGDVGVASAYVARVVDVGVGNFGRGSLAGSRVGGCTVSVWC